MGQKENLSKQYSIKKFILNQGQTKIQSFQEIDPMRLERNKGFFSFLFFIFLTNFSSRECQISKSWVESLVGLNECGGKKDLKEAAGKGSLGCNGGKHRRSKGKARKRNQKTKIKEEVKRERESELAFNGLMKIWKG